MGQSCQDSSKSKTRDKSAGEQPDKFQMKVVSDGKGPALWSCSHRGPQNTKLRRVFGYYFVPCPFFFYH